LHHNLKVVHYCGYIFNLPRYLLSANLAINNFREEIMKIFKTIIVFVIMVVLLSLVTNIVTAGQISVKLIEEVQETETQKVFVYQYQVDEGQAKELKVYVKNQSGLQIIKVGSPEPNMRTEYVYNTLGGEPNFMNIIYNYEKNVNSLREATDLAVSHYLKNL